MILYLAIYLLDTFDDYFQLYWNFDKSLFDQNRKDLFLSDGSDNLFKVDIKNRFITYNGPLNFYLMFLRQYFAIFFGFIYYFLIFKYSRKYKVNRVFYLAPLIGISISVINNVFGLPIFKQQINIPGILKDKYKLNSKLKKILGYNWDPPNNVIQFRKNKLRKV